MLSSNYLTYVLLTSLAVISVIAFTQVFRRTEGNVALEYSVSGGIWGRSDGFSLYADGKAVYRSRSEIARSIKLPEAVVADLITKVEKLSEEYPSGLRLEPPGGADYFIYSLSVRKGEKTITYQWTDLSELPAELLHVHDSLRTINSFLSRSGSILVYVSVSQPLVKVGSNVRVEAHAFNLGEKDYAYVSPTPCHPDFKVVLYGGAEPVELYPLGYSQTALCAQVLQERALKAGEALTAIYELKVSSAGVYWIEASFPYMEEGNAERSSATATFVARS